MFGLGFLFYYAHIKIKNKGVNIPRVRVYFPFRVLIRPYGNHVKNGGLCRERLLTGERSVLGCTAKGNKKAPTGRW